MNQQVEAKLTLFAENFYSIKDEFAWHEPMAKRLSALVYTLADKSVDSGRIRECHNLIKGQVGAFSNFRGMLSVYMAAALSLSQEPERVLSETLYVYDLLKDQRFWGSDFLVATAYEIATNANRIDFERMAERTRGFYDEMKANHRFQVGSDDYIFSAMLALSGLDVHQGANTLKGIFIRLKESFGRFTNRNSLLTLAQMLTLSGNKDECVQYIAKLSHALRKRKLKLDNAYTLPSLAVLSMLNMDHTMLTEEIIEARDFLREQKSFGGFSVSIHELMLYVVALMTHTHIGEAQKNVTQASVTTSVTNLIIAQQVAIMVSISAATAAGAGGC